MVQMQYGSSKEPIGVGKVSRTGDTMEGNLDFVEQIASDEVPDSNTLGSAAPRFYTSDGATVGYIAPLFRANGDKELLTRIERVIGGSTFSNYFGLTIDSAGNEGYDIKNIDTFRRTVGIASNTAHATLASLITAINAYNTGEVAIFRATPAVNLYGTASSLSSAVIVFKASANNAYYYAFSRDCAAFGNIDLSNGTVSIVHSIAENAFEVRSVTWTYSCNAGAAKTTNLKTLIDADMPSGYKFVALSGFTSGNNACIFYTLRYYDNNYSLGIRNVGASNVSDQTAVVYYLCKPI